MSFKQPYAPRPNTGNMFVNNYKKSENHPDFKGELFFDRDFLTELMNSSSDALVKVSLAAWEKTASSGSTFYSFTASTPMPKKEGDYQRSPTQSFAVKSQAPRNVAPRPAEPDEDVPF